MGRASQIPFSTRFLMGSDCPSEERAVGTAIRDCRPDSFSFLLWVPVVLTVFVVSPGVMSCTYLPKMLWACVVLGVGLAVSWRPRSPYEIALTPLGLTWFGYLAWALASLLWAPQPWVGLDRWVALLVPMLGYVVARRSRFWESEAFWVFFCAVVGIEALIGFLQYAFPGCFLASYLPGAKSPKQPKARARTR